NEFKLRDRALHVLQEAQRVDIFCGICREQMPAEKALKQLGKLMTKSHESLKTLYECSHPELDKLVELSNGIALGCRLTGAGAQAWKYLREREKQTDRDKEIVAHACCTAAAAETSKIDGEAEEEGEAELISDDRASH
ncbi:unnamed protein product, partial [Timema podura]|nr:unnamed protein product [Timema podura]